MLLLLALMSLQEVQGYRIDHRYAQWRVGPGGITKDSLYVVGLVHVSAGTWQPSTHTIVDARSCADASYSSTTQGTHLLLGSLR